jgi:hypothetical protein
VNKIVALVAGLTMTGAALPAFAQENQVRGKFAIEANGAQVDDVTGGELGIGYRVSIWRVNITPYIGGFIHGEDNDRYREETFRNGNTVCRDTTNGQFADDENCDNLAVDIYGKLEATVTAINFGSSGGIDIGGGVRFSEDQTTPYAALAVNFTSTISVRGNVGKDFWAAGVHLAF